MHFADSFRAARWIRLINLLLQAALFLALFGGLNFLAQNHSWRRDLTQNHRYSLSPETKSYLDQLERNIHIAVTIPGDSENEDLNQAYRDISGLLREYAYVTRAGAKGRVEVEYLDVYQSRKRAQELGLDQPNVVLVTCEDHRRILTLGDFYNVRDKVTKESFKGEATVTAAILDVSSPDKKKIYFLAGHGEMRTDDLDPARGLSQLRDELRQRNFEISGLDLSLNHAIPSDAALIIIAGQQGRVQPFEEELLRNYLTTRAGRIILMLDPGRPHGLENLLFDWGVVVYDDLIMDPDPRSLTETHDLRLWHFLPDPASHITDQIISNGMSVYVGFARVVSEDLGRPPDDGLSVKKLIATSEAAWGETSYRQRLYEYTPGQDLKGLLGVMVVSERLKPANNLPLSVPGGRLAVVGTSELVTNNRIFNIGNLNLFLATVNWAVDRDTQVNIPARPIQRFALALSQEELVRLRLGLLLAVPGVVAVLGFIVYWTRRN